MENGLVSAARLATRLVPIYIYLSAIHLTDRLIPTAGGEVVQIHGLSINENPYGWHFHRSSMQMSIRQVPRFRFLQFRQQELLLMMAQQASTKPPMAAGRILLIAARREVLCVLRDRVPPRQLVQGNGSFQKVQEMEPIPFMCISLLFGRRQRVRSIPYVMRARTIKL